MLQYNMSQSSICMCTCIHIYIYSIYERERELNETCKCICLTTFPLSATTGSSSITGENTPGTQQAATIKLSPVMVKGESV